jgi:CRP-like cAMP-binding protein
MSAEGILASFEGHAFLHDLGNRHMMMLASGACSFSVEEGRYLGREGQTATHFYLIQSGRVSIEVSRLDGKATRVQLIGPGEAVGWSWLVPPHRWQFDCRAVESVRGIELDAEWLREKCEQDQTLGHQLLKRLVTVLAGRLAATRLLLADIRK